MSRHAIPVLIAIWLLTPADGEQDPAGGHGPG
jgi:hypothetical protein